MDKYFGKEKLIKMAKILIDIKSCRDCPFCKEEKVYTSDSFDNVSKLTCKKKNNKVISGYADWNYKIKIPEWCPCVLYKF